MKLAISLSVCTAIALVTVTSPLDARRADDDGGVCVICHEDCPVGEHVAAHSGYTLPKVWQRNGGIHLGFACLPGTCEGNHGPEGCGTAGLQNGDLEKLERATLEGKADELRSLLETFPQNLAVNPERKAIQVRDCQGGLIAHLQLSSSPSGLLAT
jgi:hypothetical protein